MAKSKDDAEKKKPDAGTEPELVPVEELAARNAVPAWMLKGLMAANGWGQGKQVTEAEFLKARDKWLKGPMKRKVK